MGAAVVKARSGLCDGEVDNDPIDGHTYFGDVDGDGHPGDVETVTACAPPAGYSAEHDDCDDANPDVHPGADEACDLIDSNCDGEAGPLEVDADGDGFAACEECDDTDDRVHPDAVELCNGIDDDCDGATDEDARWYPDGDGDGYGDEAAPAVLAACDSPPSGHVDNATDCDDADADIRPGAQELCDPLDVDEDCDDTDSSIYPGASEAGVSLFDDPACDGIGGSLSRAELALVGEESGDGAGVSVRTAGDVDGDGLDDLIVGADGHDEGGSLAGAAYLMLGSTLAAAAPASIDLETADFVLIGEESRDGAGTSVSTAGDVDGDGLDDLIVGADGASDGGSFAGRASLILGSTLATVSSTSIGLSDVDFELTGEASHDFAGTEVSSAGDVDGDGRDDLLVGAPENDAGGSGAGKAYLVLSAL